MLSEYANARCDRYHMPGHKGQKEGVFAEVYPFDVTELSFSDNLAEPSGVILQAEKDIAKITGALRSRILTGGSTLGVLASVYAAKKFFKGERKKLAIAKSSHKSVYNALKILNIEPIFLPEKIVNGLPVLQSDGISELFDNDVIGALITTPDYFGRVTDLNKVRNEIPTDSLLIVDGAHGAHLSIFGGNNNVADLWVEGAHKSLKTLTQGALLNVNNPALIDLANEGLGIFGTSSPSYIIMASIEDGYKTLAEEGVRAFDGCKKAVRHFKSVLCDKFSVVESDDFLKLCIDLNGNADGETVGKILEENGVYAELACGRFIIFMLSASFDVAAAERLAEILNGITGKDLNYSLQADTCELTRAKSYLDAANADSEYVSLNDAEGRISATDAGFFPPCYPLVTCGEVLDKRVIARLSAKNVFGLKDNKIKVVKE